jgi:glucosylglycerate phosphorylase
MATLGKDLSHNEQLHRTHPSARFTYYPEPDYSRPLLTVPDELSDRMLEILVFLYGKESANKALPELERIMKVFFAHKPPDLIEWEKSFRPPERFSEKDVILITYGDLVHGVSGTPLQTLARVAMQFGSGVISTIHVLPFFPYSSDRGFSVLDFETVDPDLGTWEDIEALSKKFRLMFDGVFNHVSSKSRWFQEFLNGNPYYEDIFTWFAEDETIPDNLMAKILRPRTSDLLSPFPSIRGEVKVWTTFSADQIDLNFKSPTVLLKVMEILLFYVGKGADIIRLDAVTYLWEEIGTSGANLPQDHAIVKLLRAVLDAVAPYVTLITETNVPHEENVKYFGNGSDEAQMVYNFALPPLVLHTFYTQDATAILDWADTLEKVSDTATFLNFLDSHDGIGVPGVKDILPEEAIQEMVKRIERHGGFVSYRSDGSGGRQPYELNSTWFSAINDPGADEDIELQVRRFVASRAISFSLRGVPAIYLHGAIGSMNDREAVFVTRSNRSINRHHIEETTLVESFHDPESLWSMIRNIQGPLIQARIGRKAFHPNGGQQIVRLDKGVFSLVRTSRDGSEKILCLINVTDAPRQVSCPQDLLSAKASQWRDAITERRYPLSSGRWEHVLDPYQVLWLEPMADS